MKRVILASLLLASAVHAGAAAQGSAAVPSLAAVKAAKYAVTTYRTDVIKTLAGLVSFNTVAEPNLPAVQNVLRQVIEPHPHREVEVLATYVEGSAATILEAPTICIEYGMVVAMSAPDCVLAVIPASARADLAGLRQRLGAIGNAPKIAIGVTRASLGSVVDGPALDVEGWAPYPLSVGMWVAEGL